MGIRSPSWLLAPALFVAAACGGTGTDLLTLDNGNPDGGAASETGVATSYTDPFAGAPTYGGSQGGGDDSHMAGQSCFPCHEGQAGHEGEAPAFLIGGTAYADYYGNQPEEGVEVRIVDSSGNAISTYSSRNGNFYIRADQAAGFAFPAVIGARNSTSSRPMITHLTSPSMGACGQSPCHIPGGSPKNGDYYPIHVP